jgi:hypothetical protein
MDFITGLPKSKGKSVIMVIVDRLTKYAHFCALSHPFKSSTVATAFIETIQKLHGSPKIIVSDRDPIFTGHFWTELFSCLGTDPGGYRWPPTFSDWLKTVFWQFWQFTIFSRF